MPNEKEFNAVFLIYFASLLTLAIVNLINKATILDYIYVTALLFCILKFFWVTLKERR